MKTPVLETYFEEHLGTVTDSCRDGVNVRNWSIYCKILVWILQNLHCLTCKSINFVVVVKPTLMSFFGCSGCVFVIYVWFIKLGCIHCRCGIKGSILNFAFFPLCLVNICARVDKKKIKNPRKEYVITTCVKFWPIKNWLVCKFTENYCRLRLFFEFIQTQKRYPTFITK